MGWLNTNIKWIMLLSGGLTATMIYAAIAPSAALTGMFGESLDGPVAEIVVRNWGALIALVGAMLIVGAFDPPSRRLVLTIACLSKVVFIMLVLAQGGRFLAYQAGISVAIDAVMVLVFAAYLVGGARASRAG